MSRLFFALPLLLIACQPTVPRFAVSSVRVETTSARDVKTTETYDYSYSDAPLLGGARALSGGTWRRTTGDNSNSASLSFDYDSREKLTSMRSDSSEDSMQSIAYFQYDDSERLHLLETNQGPGPDIEVNVQLSYASDSDRLSMFVYSWDWWFFSVNERADVHYDSQGHILNLDGGDTFIRYEWSEDQLNRVEVQNQNDDDNDYRLSYSDGRLSRITDGDDFWDISYNEAGQIGSISAEIGDTKQRIEYSYSDGNMMGAREAPRLPLFVNYVFGLDGRSINDFDLLALPTYFGQ